MCIALDGVQLQSHKHIIYKLIKCFISFIYFRHLLLLVLHICMYLLFYVEPISLDELPRTRSGRTVKPPTQYWAGQRYVLSESTGEITVERPDLSTTPAADVSLNATPIVRFKANKVRLLKFCFSLD